MRDSKTDTLLPALRPAPPAFVLVGLRNRTLMHRFGARPLLLRLLHLDLGDLDGVGLEQLWMGGIIGEAMRVCVL